MTILRTGREFMSVTHGHITIREALQSESEIILHHRRSMFRDMGEGTVEELDRMVEVARPWIEKALSDKTYHHWLAMEESSRVAGGGGVLLCPWPPNPKDPLHGAGCDLERLYRGGVSWTRSGAPNYAHNPRLDQGSRSPER
jgi:hypothetical protein